MLRQIIEIAFIVLLLIFFVIAKALRIEHPFLAWGMIIILIAFLILDLSKKKKKRK